MEELLQRILKTVKNTPQAQIRESELGKWIDQWFLQDSTMAALLFSNQNDALKKSMLEFKLSDLWANDQFTNSIPKAESTIQDSKNVVHGSDIKAGGNIHIGDIHVHLPGNPPAASNEAPPDAAQLQDFRNLIGQARTSEVFEPLQIYLEKNAPHQLNELLILKTRWYDLGRNERLGILSRHDANLERNQINMGLLELLSPRK
ncbi:MAG: hypothetical protein KGS48_03070 [Bacteroidetes bacterium]|nr:hypothetical protein [Bacteroidota bacterium]